jgi:hypothetical protein
MKKVIIITGAIIILIAITFFSFRPSATGSTIGNINEEYTYTKAICDKNNLCQDYTITCEGDELISKSPITGAVVQQEENWKDPRTKEQIEREC